MFFWIPALTGLFGLLKNKMPHDAVWGLWIAVYGCISGCCFAFLGYLTTIFNISHQEYLQALSRYPITSQVLLFAAGPLFPLSLSKPLISAHLLNKGQEG
jgi:drug/metabolite transporter (DMT)-like permease